MDEVTIPGAIEPDTWNVVFHRKSMNPVLSFLSFGEFKHVSAFGYCVGLKVWLLYDAQWSGTRIMLMDKASIMAWTSGCDILMIKRTTEVMGLHSRLGFYCVTAIKHLIGLRCVATTPNQLYRRIIRNGGTLISAKHTASSSGRPEPRD